MALDYQKNYYEILDCTVDSTADDIKTAYRKLARKYHPDVNKTPEAINLFKDVIEAYKILSNPVEREKYNILKGYFKSAQNFSKNSTPNCTKNYGYSKQNIYVLMADGTNPNIDRHMNDGTYESSPLDLDGDGLADNGMGG